MADKNVAQQLAQAWMESAPGPVGGREQGGFVVETATGLKVARWPAGEQDKIMSIPPHPGCRIAEGAMVASFHTHPSTGPEFMQEPSETDQRMLRRDPNLKAADYVGEFVISEAHIYLVAKTGEVEMVGPTARFLPPGGKDTFNA